MKMAGTKYIMKSKNQTDGKWTDVCVPLYDKDGNILNATKKFDDDDVRSLLDDGQSVTYSNISEMHVTMELTTDRKKFMTYDVTVCADDSQNYYTVMIEDVYYSVYKTAVRFIRE